MGFLVREDETKGGRKVSVLILACGAMWLVYSEAPSSPAALIFDDDRADAVASSSSHPGHGIGTSQGRSGLG